MTELHNPYCPNAVDLYFVCSERLRNRGWHGVGDAPGWWLAPNSVEPMTSAEALRKTGVGQFYAWQVTREIVALRWETAKDAAHSFFEAAKEFAERAERRRTEIQKERVGR